MPILHLHQRHRSGTNTKPAGRRHFRFFSSARPAEPTAPAPSSSIEETRRGRDSARDLMIEEYLAYPQDARVEDVLDDLRDKAEQYAHYDVQYAYVLSEERLVGVLRLRDLLLSPRSMPIALIMIAEPIHVHGDARLEELKRVFDRHPLFGIPAVDEQHRMIGVVRRAAVEKAFQEGSNRAFLKFMGIVGGEELRSMPFRQRSLSRLSWLGMNVFLNVIAASIIAYHQDILSAVISLAVFLPIISDMSGCSGNQAVAVTMRELMLGLAKPSHAFRVLSKEATVGVFNGLVLGLMLGALAYLWKGNPALGLVVGAALALNTIVAVCLGGVIPLLLRKLNQDPALASGPILTTMTDMCGFFFVLSFARLALPWLIGA
ncbi:MAG: magnesium transporter [Thermoguttaceae bacterium]